jgi:serine protease DegQ
MLKLISTCLMIMGLTLVLNNSCLASIPAKSGLQSLAPMLKESMPSVVSISGNKKIQALSQNPFETQQGPVLEEQISVLIGSGVIVDKQKGYILTNSHVVAGLEDIMVTLNDRRRFAAKILGHDKASDLALLQIDADQLVEIKFADSDELAVGDFVVAIGNPYNFNHTVTSGIISALGRTNVGVEGYYDFIQTDAAINFGNSGGALLNLKGELVGINTAILSSSAGGGGSIGLGFAIPSNMAKGILSQLANSGKVDRGPLGVRVQNLTSLLAEGFGAKTNQGAIVIDIIPNTPAEKSGIEVGDIITFVDKKVVKDAAHLRTLISLIPAGTEVTLHILRNKDELSKKVTITNPLDSLIKGETIFTGLKGALLDYLEDPEQGIKGFKVIEIQAGSLAANSDLMEGDVILAANQKKTLSLDLFKQSAQSNKKILLLQVLRGKLPCFVGVAGATKAA